MNSIFYMKRNKKNITVFRWAYLHLLSTIEFEIYCLFTDKNGDAFNNLLARIIINFITNKAK